MEGRQDSMMPADPSGEAAPIPSSSDLFKIASDKMK